MIPPRIALIRRKVKLKNIYLCWENKSRLLYWHLRCELMACLDPLIEDEKKKYIALRLITLWLKSLNNDDVR